MSFRLASVYVAPFREDNFPQIAELLGADRVVFGSDWPHPEGLKDPLALVDDLAGLPDEDVEKNHGQQHDEAVQGIRSRDNMTSVRRATSGKSAEFRQ